MNGSKFKALREQSGMTQPECAERFDVDLRTIQRWECGEFPISPSTEALIRILAHPAGARLADVIYGSKRRNADPLADMVENFDQSAENIRAARAGRTPQPIPPPRDRGERRPERTLERTDAELRDPLATYDHDGELKAARKRGPQPPKVAAKAIDDDDPIGDMVATHDDRVRALRERRRKGDDE